MNNIERMNQLLNDMFRLKKENKSYNDPIIINNKLRNFVYISGIPLYDTFFLEPEGIIIQQFLDKILQKEESVIIGFFCDISIDQKNKKNIIRKLSVNDEKLIKEKKRRDKHKMKQYKFKVKNEYNNYLKKILENIDESNYIWKIDEDGVYDLKGEFLFENDKYDNNTFQKIINQEIYYTVSIDLKLFNNDHVKKNHDSYILNLIIIDNEFVEIFTKSEKILNQILNNISKHNLEQK